MSKKYKGAGSKCKCDRCLEGKQHKNNKQNQHVIILHNGDHTLPVTFDDIADRAYQIAKQLSGGKL